MFEQLALLDLDPGVRLAAYRVVAVSMVLPATISSVEDLLSTLLTAAHMHHQVCLPNPGLRTSNSCWRIFVASSYFCFAKTADGHRTHPRRPCRVCQQRNVFLYR